MPYACILAAAVLVYFRTVFFGFTWYDDNLLIVDSLPFISKLSNIPAAFTQQVFANTHYYRPLLTISFMLNAAIAGASPFIYHLSNIALHACAAMTLFYFLRLWGHITRFALAAALLFSVHPAAGQAVAWIPGRNDILLAIFSLLSFSCFMRGLTGQRRAFWLHLLFYFCALLTKENAAVLPGLLACYAFYIRPGGRWPVSPGRTAWLWAAVTFAWLACRWFALGALSGAAPAAGLSFLHSFQAALTYIGRAVFPYGLTVMPVLENMSLAPGIIAAVLLTAFICCASTDRRKSVFGAAWFLAFLLPTMNRHLSAGFIEFGDHRIYTSLAGLFLLAGDARFPAAAKTAAAALLLPLFAGISFSRLPVFQDSVSFWEGALKGSPSSLVLRIKLGSVYLKAGRCPQALAQFSAALETRPDDVALNMNMGNCLLACGDAVRAAFFWEKALTADPGNAQALRNIALFYCSKNNFREAARYVEKLLAAGEEVNENILADTAKYRRTQRPVSRRF